MKGHPGELAARPGPMAGVPRTLRERCAAAGNGARSAAWQALLGRQAPLGSGTLAEAIGAFKAAIDEMGRRDLDDVIERTRGRFVQARGTEG